MLARAQPESLNFGDLARTDRPQVSFVHNALRVKSLVAVRLERNHKVHLVDLGFLRSQSPWQGHEPIRAPISVSPGVMQTLFVLVWSENLPSGV